MRRGPGQWYVANMATEETSEPTTYKEALEASDARFWKQAMDEEIASLLSNKTWTIEELPPDAKAIPVKWVFKIERYKARLVAKGLLAWGLHQLRQGLHATRRS